MKIRVHCSTGGKKTSEERKILAKGVHVIVGTPGRVNDNLRRGLISLTHLKIFVLDEADCILSYGFQEQIDEIFQYLEPDIQICLFSATMPPDILELSQQFLKDPAIILVKKEKLTLEGIKQFFLPVDTPENKFKMLCELFCNIDIAQCVVFVNTKEGVEQLARQMTESNFTVSAIHSGIEQTDRDRIMYEFRTACSRVLISTDLLARGIDVQQVQLVINFDIPKKIQTYIHRIGRGNQYP